MTDAIETALAERLAERDKVIRAQAEQIEHLVECLRRSEQALQALRQANQPAGLLD
jgi:hypothetical protein